MRNNLAGGMALAEGVDVLGAEHLVHRAEALPQDDFRFPDLRIGEPAARLIEIPQRHRFGRDAHAVRRVAPEMLVGEEQHFLALPKRPFEHAPGIRRGAHQAAVAAAEGLEVGGRIDIGHRRDVLVRIEHGREFAPGALDLGETGHVGHGAAGGEVGQDRHLLRTREDVGDLGHEVHAAEHDVFGVARRRQARELERIAGKIGVAEYLVALVVMPENDHALAERRLRRADTRVAFVVGDDVVGVVGQCSCRHRSVFARLPVPESPRGDATRLPSPPRRRRQNSHARRARRGG